MTKRFRLLSAFVIVTILVGCSSMKLDDFADGSPPLVLESYFLGRTEAWGLFEDRFGRVRRQFKVEIDGTFDGRELTLVEDFVYADGAQDQRIWRITALGDGRYQGRADDVVGVADGQARGNALHWRYDMLLPIGDGTWQVHFDDWMFLQDDGVLINRATVTKFGLALGQVTLFFRKP
jgi:hypothetical protein